MPDTDWRRNIKELVRDVEFGARFRRTGFYLVDMEEGWTQNSFVIESLGYPEATLESADIEALMHPEDKPTFLALWGRVLQGRDDGFSGEFRVRDKEGAWHWIQSHGTVLTRTASGGVGLYAGFDQDITARKEAETMLRSGIAEEERRFALAETLRAAGMAASTMLEADATVDLVLHQARLYVPFQLAAVYAHDDEVLTLIGQKSDDDSAKTLPLHADSSPIWELLRDRSPRIHDDIGRFTTYPSETTTEVFRSWLGIPLVLHRELIGVLEFWHVEPGAFHSEQVWPAMAFGDTLSVALSNASKYQSLMAEARTDPLTGLYSRRFLMEKGSEILARLGQEGQAAALILLDIDHFKAVNDTYGHLVGDEVLKGAAALCKKALRQEDILCRFGGEEFIALLPNVSETVAHNVAERIRASLEGWSFPGIEARVTASFGVVTSASGKSAGLQELIRLSDEAMYAAKKGGRNRVATVAVPD